jgi:hypothetical protein
MSEIQYLLKLFTGQTIHRHLGDDGKPCGCYSDDSMDDWFRFRHRQYVNCDTHKRRQERAYKRYLRHGKAEKEYNKDTNQRLKQIVDQKTKIEIYFHKKFTKELHDIDDDMVPIKYLYELKGYRKLHHNISQVNSDEMRWFNVQKIHNRYYCCKNKIAYHNKRKPEIKNITKQKEERFISYHRWTNDDLTIRSYDWIKTNDKEWLKEYKLRKRDSYIVLFKEDLVDIDHGAYETDGEYESGDVYIPKFMR